MPELPEVETVRRGLERLIIGRRIENISYNWPKSFPNDPALAGAFLKGARFRSARRRAKILLLDLDTDWSLAIHLKMTGQLVYVDSSERWGGGHPNASLIASLPDRSTRVILDLDQGRLYFNDQRKFGWMRLLPSSDLKYEPYISRLGPEPLEENFSAVDFHARLKHRANSKIKAAILDQTTIAGVGNIYADEALWRSRIHPATLAGSLSLDQAAALLHGIRESMLLSLEQGGSSSRNYVDAEGRQGSYLAFAGVFNRQGQACKRCGYTIEKIRCCGRGTHLCPNCQKP